MRYLNLSDREMKKLLHLRRDTFALYIIKLLIISVGSYALLKLILNIYLNLFFVLIFALAYTAYVVYANRKYLTEIIYKQKKVYRGVLSFKIVSKRSKKGKYIFNVDGRNFYVNRQNFEYLKEGDTVEFHVSSSTKHLYCVEKVG